MVVRKPSFPPHWALHSGRVNDQIVKSALGYKDAVAESAGESLPPELLGPVEANCRILCISKCGRPFNRVIAVIRYSNKSQAKHIAKGQAQNEIVWKLADRWHQECHKQSNADCVCE